LGNSFGPTTMSSTKATIKNSQPPISSIRQA
jgi:hypothetical protein